MFWQAAAPKRSPATTHPWRARLRRAVDLAIAFATLEDAPAGRASGRPPAGHPDAPRADHLHRRRLREPELRRRPGAVQARVTPCTTPLAPPPPRRRGRPRGRREARPR